MSVYLGLTNYDGLNAEQFAAPAADGWVLGDLFCNDRMFRHGDNGLADTVRQVVRAGREAVYQTPMYLTDRNFPAIARTADYFYEEYGVRTFLVQDVGFADWLAERRPDAHLIWSRMGRSRASILNRELPEFLRQLGVQAMETSMPGRMARISDAGLDVCAVCGDLRYHTLSRECYTKYLLGCYDGLCGRACRSEKLSLNRERFSMSVDGHLLGASRQEPKDPAFYQAANKYAAHIMIYADELPEAERLLNTVRAHS